MSNEKVDVRFGYDTDYIMLAYRRQPRLRGDEHVHDGHFDTCVNEEVERASFVEMTYADMFRSLSELANKFPQAKLVMRRLEQGPDSTALGLGEDTCALIRDDPEAYIAQSTLPPQRVVLHLGADAKVTEGVAVNTIRSGHDTLADAFGDVVFLKQRLVEGEQKVESPTTGRWVVLECDTDGTYFCCEWWTNEFGDPEGDTDLLLPVVQEAEGWAGIPIDKLLSLKVERFFLPRKWNENGPWISHEELKTKYERYLKEKEACTRTSKAAPQA